MRTTRGRATAEGSIKKFGVCVGAWLGKGAQERPRCYPKLCQNGAENLPKWTQMGPRRWPGGPTSGEKTPSKQKGREHATDPPFLAEKVANMAPTWAPRWSQNRTKFDTKINQKINASWDRFLEGFWWIWGGKMEPSWHQNRIKNRSQLRKAIF